MSVVHLRFADYDFVIGKEFAREYEEQDDSCITPETDAGICIAT